MTEHVDVDQLIHQAHTLGDELNASPNLQMKTLAASMRGFAQLLLLFRDDIRVDRDIRASLADVPLEIPEDPALAADTDCCQ